MRLPATSNASRLHPRCGLDCGSWEERFCDATVCRDSLATLMCSLRPIALHRRPLHPALHQVATQPRGRRAQIRRTTHLTLTREIGASQVDVAMGGGAMGPRYLFFARASRGSSMTVLISAHLVGGPVIVAGTLCQLPWYRFDLTWQDAWQTGSARRCSRRPRPLMRGASASRWPWGM